MRVFLSMMAVAMIFAPPCRAQQADSSAAQGDPYHTTNLTYAGAPASSNLTGTQATVTLPTGFGQLANVPGGLPETRLDSLVKDSGYSDLIYGDEGTDGPPPYYGFTDEHYIYHGMSADTGLTTGHATVLPTAWGWTNTMSNGPGVAGDFGAPTVYTPGQTTGVPAGYDSGYGSGYAITPSGNVNGYSLGYSPNAAPIGDPAVVNTEAPVNLAGTESGF
jgi:hypothetical protein